MLPLRQTRSIQVCWLKIMIMHQRRTTYLLTDHCFGGLAFNKSNKAFWSRIKRTSLLSSHQSSLFLTWIPLKTRVTSYVSEWWDFPAQLVATVMNHMKHKENNNAKFDNMNPHNNSDGDKVLLFHVWHLLSNLSWRSYLRDVEFKVTFDFLILKIIFERCRI